MWNDANWICYTRSLWVCATTQCCIHAHILKPHTKLNVTSTQNAIPNWKRDNTGITDASIESDKAQQCNATQRQARRRAPHNAAVGKIYFSLIKTGTDCSCIECAHATCINVWHSKLIGICVIIFSHEWSDQCSSLTRTVWKVNEEPQQHGMCVSVYCTQWVLSSEFDSVAARKLNLARTEYREWHQQWPHGD